MPIHTGDERIVIEMFGHSSVQFRTNSNSYPVWKPFKGEGQTCLWQQGDMEVKREERQHTIPNPCSKRKDTMPETKAVSCMLVYWVRVGEVSCWDTGAVRVGETGRKADPGPEPCDSLPVTITRCSSQLNEILTRGFRGRAALCETAQNHVCEQKSELWSGIESGRGLVGRGEGPV